MSLGHSFGEVFDGLSCITKQYKEAEAIQHHTACSCEETRRRMEHLSRSGVPWNQTSLMQSSSLVMLLCMIAEADPTFSLPTCLLPFQWMLCSCSGLPQGTDLQEKKKITFFLRCTRSLFPLYTVGAQITEGAARGWKKWLGMDLSEVICEQSLYKGMNAESSSSCH